MPDDDCVFGFCQPCLSKKKAESGVLDSFQDESSKKAAKRSKRVKKSEDAMKAYQEVGVKSPRGVCGRHTYADLFYLQDETDSRYVQHMCRKTKKGW